MKLYYFPANAAWAFVFGRDLRTATPIALHGHEMFHATRAAAVDAALTCGLRVNADNTVAVIESEGEKP